MALFSDPQVTQLVEQYFDHDRNPQFLYKGSQEAITEELKAWVVRRKKVYKEQMELRDQAQTATKEFMSSPAKSREPARMSACLKRHSRSMVLKSETSIESERATYLLDTLKSRGLTWPELWWQPELDGGVCSFLGTVDEKFDAHATLTILEDREEEARLRATAAEINPQVISKFAAVEAAFGRKLGEEEMIAMYTAMAEATFDAGERELSTDELRKAMADVLRCGRSDVGGSERETSRQEKRSKARTEAKAKAKHGKQAEN